MGTRDLLIFPCSAAKEGSPLARPIPLASIKTFIGHRSARLLEAARDMVFKDRKKKNYIDHRSPLTPALALYSGNQYKVEGFKDMVAEMIRSGGHCLVISGGYGLIRAEEPIHEYEAEITSNRKYWMDVIPEVLADYIQRNQIIRVYIGCSSSYSAVLKRQGWSGNAEVFWCLPRLPAGEGGAMVKVPRLTGEAIVELVSSGFQPSKRWRKTWPV